MEKIISILMGIIAVLKSQFKNENSVVGIKETKEMVIGANEVSLIMISKFRDGVQFADFTELYTELKEDAEFKAAMNAAYDNYQAIPAEIADIDAGEGLELAEVQLPYITKLVALFPKKES